MMKINNLKMNVGKTIFVLTLLLTVQVTFAQTTLNWVGDVSSDAYDQSNWSPAEGISGNILTVDSANKVDNLPIIGEGSGNDSIISFSTMQTGLLTIDKGPYTLLVQNNTKINGDEQFVWDSDVLVKSGKVIFKSNVYIKDSSSVWDIQGDETNVSFQSLLFWSSGSGFEYGGKMYISKGATVSTGVRGPERMGGTGESAALIQITDSAQLTVPADVVGYIYELRDSGYLKAGEGEEIVATYDVGAKTTTVNARPNTVFRIDPEGSSQNIFENEVGSTIRVHENVGKTNKTGFQWKYSTTSGSGYIDITGAIEDTLAPVFVTAGLYYVVCVGALEGGGEEISNEIIINVVPEKVFVNPLSEQFLREGQMNGAIVATYDGTATSKEWFISTTSGSGYEPFETPVTGDTLKVEFPTANQYYVICKAMIGGTEYMSKEVPIKVAGPSDPSLDLTWVGTVDNDALNPFNWSPVAHIDGNSIVRIDTSTLEDNIVLTGPIGKISVNNFELFDSASFTFDLADDDSVTLSGGSSSYIFGNIVLNSGYIYWRKGNLYLERPSSQLTINGGMFEINAYLLLGRKDLTDGGAITISGDGVLKQIYAPTADGDYGVIRWSDDSLKSVMTIIDDGKFITKKDYRSELTTRMATNQLQTAEGRELVIFYDEATDFTTVTSMAATDFKATPYDYDIPNYVGVNSDALTLTAENTSEITNLEWKYGMYADSINMSFVAPQTSSTCNPVFDAAGLYYVACFGELDGEPVMTNIIKVQAVSVTISPTDIQVVEALTAGNQLLVTESLNSDSKEWKYSMTSGSGYQSMTPTAATGDDYTPLFADGGEYYIVCESMYEGTSILSNEVLVKVVEIYLDDITSQTITQNEDGDTITVIESVTVDSREWKYSTTSGSDYVSFATPETDTIYVPNFDTEGTYYVVCEVTVGNLILTTEEVEIEVEIGTGISFAGTRATELNVYPNPSGGTFNIDPGSVTNYRLQIFDITGHKIYESVNNDGMKELTLNKKGMYVVKVVTGNVIKISRISVK